MQAQPKPAKKARALKSHVDTWHEWALVACRLIEPDIAPALACLPSEWFVDEFCGRVWAGLADGRQLADICGEISDRRWRTACLADLGRASLSVFLFNTRWHAHEVYEGHVRTVARLNLRHWLQRLDLGYRPDVLVTWPSWEAAAIDEAAPNQALAALDAEWDAYAPWLDERLYIVLSDRARGRLSSMELAAEPQTQSNRSMPDDGQAKRQDSTREATGSADREAGRGSGGRSQSAAAQRGGQGSRRERRECRCHWCPE